MKYIFTLYFALLFCRPASAQSFEKTFFEKFITENRTARDSVVLKKSFDSSIARSEKKFHSALESIYKILLADLYSSAHENINPRSTHLYNEAAALAQQCNSPGLEAWILTRCGFYYYSYSAYEASLPYFMLAERLMDSFPEDKSLLPMTGETYMKNAFFLGILQDYPKSIAYLSTALQYTSADSRDYGTLLFALGMDHYHLGKQNEAQAYFQKTMTAAEGINDEVRYAKALGEMARICKDRKEYSKAIDLLKKDIVLSQKNNSDRNKMYAQLLLSEIYLLQNNLSEAQKTLTEAASYAGSKPYLKGFEYDALSGLLKIAIEHRDEKSELELRRRSDILKPEIAKSDGEDAIKRVRLQVQKERLSHRVEIEKANREKQAFIKMAFAAIAVLLGVSIVFIFIAHRRKLKARAYEYAQKVAFLQMEKLKSEKQLAETDNTLESYKTYLAEKNIQIAALEEEIERINTSSSAYLEQESGELYKLLKSHLMTEENWQNFKRVFIKERSEEYRALMKQFPDISEAALRIVLLQKMELNNSETAQLLGITIDAVKKAKQRLRKKYDAKT